MRSVTERAMVGATVGVAVANAGALAGFVGTLRFMKTDLALEPGTWCQSGLFAVCVMALSAVAGAAGGAACAAIARRRWVGVVTAVVLLSWWAAEAWMKIQCVQPDACAIRAPDASITHGARAGLLWEPAWSALTTPFAIALGVLGGAALVLERSRRQTR